MFEITYIIYGKTVTAYLPSLVAIEAIKNSPACEILSTRWMEVEEV